MPAQPRPVRFAFCDKQAVPWEQLEARGLHPGEAQGRICSPTTRGAGLMPRGCTCPPDGGTLCARCAGMLARAIMHPLAQPPARPQRIPAPSAPPAQRLDRYRSETERRYARYLDGEVNAGIVARYYYEPCKGLWLAPKLSYTPDFLVIYCDGERGHEMHEVKGEHIWPKDWDRLKMAAQLYQCWTFRLAQWKEQRWQWQKMPAL